MSQYLIDLEDAIKILADWKGRSLPESEFGRTVNFRAGEYLKKQVKAYFAPEAA